MKIIISAYSCDPTLGSEPGNGWNRAVSNALKGHNVVCFTTYSVEKEKIIAERIKLLKLETLRMEYIFMPDWINKLYKYEPGMYFHYIVWQHNAYLKAKQLMKKEHFDLVHHVTLGSIHMGSELYKLNLPMVYGPLGGGQYAPESFKNYMYDGWKSEVRRKWMRKLMKLYPSVGGAIKNASIVLTTNQETFDVAMKFKPKKIQLFADTTLPDNFFENVLPKKEHKKDELKIFWIGRIYAFKGLNVVMEALSKVKIPFKLNIVGHGPYCDYIPRWIKQYNLEGKVDFKGKVPWEQVKEAYLENDVFMYCSLRDSSAVQFVEAMALGLPIITLDMHGSRTLVPDGAGIRVKVTDPDTTTTKLAEAVEYMYHNPQKRKEFSNFAFEHAQNFKESNNSERFVKIYNEIINGKIVPTEDAVDATLV
jgi:glycosyltransferase involved in cell wall biosynthesis